MKAPLSRKRTGRAKSLWASQCHRLSSPDADGQLRLHGANYADGKRRFDSYADEALALEAAAKLAAVERVRSLGGCMTNEQASEYAAAVQKLKPANVALLSAADTVAQALKFVSDLPASWQRRSFSTNGTGTSHQSALPTW